MLRGQQTDQIPTVHYRWLLDCHTERKLVPTEAYETPETDGPDVGRPGHDSTARPTPATLVRGKSSQTEKVKLRLDRKKSASNFSSSSFWEDLGFDVGGSTISNTSIAMEKENVSEPLHRDDSSQEELSEKMESKRRKGDERVEKVQQKRKSLPPTHAPSSEVLSGASAAVEGSVEGSSRPGMSNDINKENVDEPSASQHPCDPHLFAGMKFASLGFTEEQTQILEGVVTQYGGEFHSELSSLRLQDACVIVPFRSTKEQCQQYKAFPNVATEHWLERCLEDNLIYDPIESVVFQPFFDNPLPEFASFTIGITGYDGLERQHIGNLCTLLGAEFSERFSRKNTHLLCKPGQKYMSSMKYIKAVEWNIPVVTAEWLDACALHNAVVDMEPYHPSKASVQRTKKPALTRKLPSDEPILDHRMQAEPEPMAADDDEVEGRRTDDMQNILHHLHSDSHEQDVEEEISSTSSRLAFRPKFDIQEALSTLESPARDKNRPRMTPSVNRIARNRKESAADSPIDESFAKNLGKAIKNVQKLTASANNLHNEMKDDAVDHIQESEECFDDGNADETGILHGVVLSFSQKLAEKKHELYQLSIKLGADVQPVFNSKCTHLGTRVNETFKDFKTAKIAGKFIVSPLWLQKCQETGSRANELDFPHTYNPHKNLKVNVSSVGSRPSSAGTDKSDTDSRTSRRVTAKLDMSPVTNRSLPKKLDMSPVSKRSLSNVSNADDGVSSTSKPRTVRAKTTMRRPSRGQSFSSTVSSGESHRESMIVRREQEEGEGGNSTFEDAVKSLQNGHETVARREGNEEYHDLAQAQNGTVSENAALTRAQKEEDTPATFEASKSSLSVAAVDELLNETLNGEKMRRRQKGSSNNLHGLLTTEDVAGGNGADRASRPLSLSMGGLEMDDYSYTQQTQTEALGLRGSSINRGGGLTAVMYDDPDGRVEKRKLIEQLQTNIKRRKTDDDMTSDGMRTDNDGSTHAEAPSSSETDDGVMNAMGMDRTTPQEKQEPGARGQDRLKVDCLGHVVFVSGSAGFSFRPKAIAQQQINITKICCTQAEFRGD
ncbi:DNA topoisomerase 2-binding protein 1 [Quaeritorhiza haematococci]|nr:DNA topoisomerase 2-binding protein 1 [Quaeritorhiza haematococci]